jgi:hypothetical protein
VNHPFGDGLDIAIHEPRQPESRDEDERALEGFEKRDGAKPAAVP